MSKVVKNNKKHIILAKEANKMKHLLFVVLENKPATRDVIHELSKQGFNGTILSSTSVHNFMLDEEEDVPSFFSLAHISENKFVHNTTLYFILEEEKMKEVQQIIRDITANFTKVKGGMFKTPIESFEGSF